MLSPPRRKTVQADDIRSPSIPTEIGPGGENFHAYFLEDSGESDISTSRLGISRPSYGSPDMLDFSPVLQSRKSMTKTKSALDKYQKGTYNKPAATIATTPKRITHVERELAKDGEAAKKSPRTKPQPAEQAIHSPFRAFRQKQRNRALKKNEEKMAKFPVTKNTAPFRNPMKALKFAKSGQSTKQIQKQVPAPSLQQSGYDSCSTIEMDGSIDLQKSFPTQHVYAATRSSRKVFDNERFYTPAQHAGLLNQSSSHSSLSSILTTDTNPLLSTHPLSSPGRNHGRSLGIAPAPRTSTKRIIVPHVKPSKNKNIYTIFVLLIQPSQKIFELVRLNYNPSKTTLRQLLQMVPMNCTEEDLSTQVYTGFCRPNASSSSNKSLTNLSLTASIMARDGSCARIACGEVIAAIPDGYTSKETQILARHIMKNPKMVKLLSKKSPLSKAKYYKKLIKSKSVEHPEKGHLGIQPRNSMMPTDNNDRISSSVLFTPLTDTIVEESCHGTTSIEIEENKRIQSPKGKLAAKLERVSSDSNIMSADHSCNSSLTSINSLRRGPYVQKVVTNIESKLNNLESRRNSLNTTPRSSRKSPQPLIVDDDEGSRSQHEVSLNTSQLEAIKREAAQAARVAAEEAFAKRMEELVHKLDVTDEEKNRLLEVDDMSYHSAMSFAMNGSFASLPPPKESCEFPVSVTISAQDPPPSVIQPTSLSPHGQYGAYASRLVLTSPYAPAPGSRLLTPLASSSSRPGPLLSPLPTMTSPETTDSFSPKAVDPMKVSDNILKQQDSINRTMTTAFTQGSDEFDDDDLENSLITETMEGFYNVTKNVVSKFIERRKRRLQELPSKLLKQKLHLKVMSIVCLMFLTSHSMNSMNNEDDKDLNKIFTFEDVDPASSDNDENDGKFSIVDLQQILFWFLILTKGQQFLSKNRPKRKKRRGWKSRVVPIKH